MNCFFTRRSEIGFIVNWCSWNSKIHLAILGPVLPYSVKQDKYFKQRTFFTYVNVFLPAHGVVLCENSHSV